MTREHANRIPEKEGQSFSAWTIPTVGDKKKALSSAEKEDRERREKEAKSKGEVVGETVDENQLNGPITAVELERITEEAHQEGYKAGFDQGLKQGAEEGKQKAYEEHKQKLADDCKRLSILAAGLTDPFEQQTQHLHTTVLNTIMSLSASIVKKEFTVGSNEISQLVEQALDALPKSAKDISIHLHPKDIALLEEHFPEKVKSWSLIPDTDISVGGVLVDSRDSKVDFTLENRLAQLEQQFIGGEFTQSGNNNEEVSVRENPITSDYSQKKESDSSDGETES